MSTLFGKIKTFGNLAKTEGLKPSISKLFAMSEVRTGTLVGQDQLGNKYFEDRTAQFGRDRWVEYKSGWEVSMAPEATQIPSEWHQWLHRMSDTCPATEPLKGVDGNDILYQKDHATNRTLRPVHERYLPPGHPGNPTDRFRPGAPGWGDATKDRGEGKLPYQKWQPKAVARGSK